MGADKKSAPSAAALVEEAISELHKAQRELASLQGQHEVGSPTWHALETIDDRIHDALTKLGD